MSTVLPPPGPSVRASDDPYAAPVARVDDAPTGDIVLAGRGTRLLAAIVDTLIAIGPVMLVSVLAPGLLLDGVDSTEVDPFYVGLLAFAAVAVLLVVVVVNLVLLHRSGQTIAKRMFGIRIVRGDGSPCALSRIILARWLPMAVAGMVPLVGPLASLIDSLMIFRENHRCLHDEIADTIVVTA